MRIDVLPNGVIHFRDDNMHRAVYQPGEDVSQADPLVQEAAAEHWTPERIAAYQAAQEQQ